MAGQNHLLTDSGIPHKLESYRGKRLSRFSIFKLRLIFQTKTSLCFCCHELFDKKCGHGGRTIFGVILRLTQWDGKDAMFNNNESVDNSQFYTLYSSHNVC